MKTKEEIIELIDNRIKSEFRKHKKLDWSKIAAHKIYASLIYMKREELIDFLYWREKEIHPADAHNLVEKYLKSINK